MKKFLTIALLALTIAVSACWFTATDWESVYFTRVNDTDCTPVFGAFPSYTMDNEVGTQNFPLTVFVHIVPSVTNGIPIDEVLLQWKYDTVLGTWHTICTLADFTFIIDYTKPLALWGSYAVNPAGIQSGDNLLFRLQSIDAVSVNAQIDVDTTVSGTNGWQKLWIFSTTVGSVRR